MRSERILVGARGALCSLCMLLLVAGCAGRRDNCDKPAAYSSSTSGPPLRVPPDLSPPKASDAFAIPPGPTSQVVNPPCGHYPPKIADVGGEAQAEQGPPPAEAAPESPPVQPSIKLAPPPEPETAAEPVPPPPAPAVSEDVTAEVSSLIQDWSDAWAAGEFDRYLSFYAEDFDPPGELTIEEWQTARRGRLEKHPSTAVFLDTLTFNEAAPDRVAVEFVQRSELDGVVSSLRKGLVLVRRGEEWRIQKELVVEVLSNPR